MSNIELLKSGGLCFCVKFTKKNKTIIDDYLQNNSYICFHTSPSLHRWTGYYINIDTKIYATGIIGVIVVKPIGKCIISVDEFLLIASIFEGKHQIW